MRIKCIYTYPFLLLLFWCFVSCNYNSGKDKNKETATTGSITIAVDESLRSVMEQQLKVWDSSYPDGHITAQYLPESECFSQLMQGKVKLIITARNISPTEKSNMQANKMFVGSMAIASDAIAVITNPAAVDSEMTTGILNDIIQGKFVRKYKIAFDNAKSSVVNYMADSLLHTDTLTNAFALKTNEAVIEYVATNKDAIGLLSVTNVYDPNDSSGIGGFYKNINVVAMRNDSTYKFYQPHQYAILYKFYPLTRDIYYITSESYSNSLASGFIGFLCNQQGQLIFKKSWMVPLRAQLEVKEVEITH